MAVWWGLQREKPQMAPNFSKSAIFVADMMDRIKKLISVVLLVVYATLFASSNLFYHSHHIDGRVIVHSHLLGGQQHTHTSVQILAIDLITSSAIDLEEPAHTPLFFEGKSQVLSCGETVLPPKKVSIVHFSLRAPPEAGC